MRFGGQPSCRLDGAASGESKMSGILLFSIPLQTFFSKARDSFSRSFHSAKQIYLLCIPWPGTHVKLQARACSRDHAPVPAGTWPGQYHDLRVQSGIVTRDDRRIDVAFLFGARLAAIPLWRAIPLVGDLPFLKGFSLWTNQSECVYFYWPPGPKPVVTISTRVGPGSRLCHNNMVNVLRMV